MSAPTREPLLDACEALRNQRDVIYSMTVNPRRNCRRALTALDEGRMDDVRWFLREASQELADIPAALKRWEGE